MIPDWLSEESPEITPPKPSILKGIVEPTKVSAHTTRAMILDFLRDSGPSRPIVISTALKKSPPELSTYLAKLIDLGFVEKVPVTYKLTENAINLWNSRESWPDLTKSHLTLPEKKDPRIQMKRRGMLPVVIVKAFAGYKGEKNA